MPIRRTVLHAALLALVALPPAGATTYYVSNAGDDGDDGLTPQTAWQTLQHAANQAIAGDTVIALRGSYRGFNLFTSGSDGAPITFTANPGIPTPNPEVIVDLPNDFTGQDAINLEGASWIVVEGFTILGGGGITRAGIRSVGFAVDAARNNVFRANRIDQPGRWGIFTGFVDDLLIEANETSRAGDEHGIYVSNSGDRPVIRGNRIWGNFANGIHMNGDLSQGGDGVISGAVVEDNLIYDNGIGGGSGVNCDGVQDSVIQNNKIYDAHASGISLYRIDGGAPSTGNLVVNNTIVVASDGRWAMNIQDGSSANTLRNNVFLSDHPDRGSIDLCGSCLTGLVSDNNAVEDRFSLDEIWIDLETWRQQTGQDAESFLVGSEELFVDAATFDLRLATGSPAIDAGAPTQAPPLDLESVPRPQGAGWDIGAHEFVDGLLLLGPAPGVAGEMNRFEIFGGAPASQLFLFGSTAEGVTPIPGCPGVEASLDTPRLRRSATADAAGYAPIEVRIPAAAGGQLVLFQGAAPASCEVSERIDYMFP